jgi:hypothetical protein
LRGRKGLNVILEDGPSGMVTQLTEKAQKDFKVVNVLSHILLQQSVRRDPVDTRGALQTYIFEALCLMSSSFLKELNKNIA